jgi:chromosome partitioning protein
VQIISVMSQKGGAGKSTLTRQLSTAAAEDGPAFIIDRDVQATASKWWDRRQTLTPAPERPELFELATGSLAAEIAEARAADGVLFVDTAPAVTEREAEAARVADLVIVPVRPSGDDLEAVGDTLAMLRRLERRAVIVVNCAKTVGRATEARAALSVYPVPVCPTHLADRTVYQDAHTEGRSVLEMRGAAARQAADELRAVWHWIRGQINE